MQKFNTYGKYVYVGLNDYGQPSLIPLEDFIPTIENTIPTIENTIPTLATVHGWKL